MGKQVKIDFVPIRSCLVNLPLSIHAPLVDRGIVPQSLVVHLTYTVPQSKEQKHFYVGWTGMPSQVSSVAHQVRSREPIEKVEIDPHFGEMMGIRNGDNITIDLLRDTPVATRVTVTPLSADDWEIIERNAEFVETNLLGQVRALKEGMVVGCWVNANTVARFSVDATLPASTTAVLLTSATELAIAPRTRAREAEQQNEIEALSSDTEDESWVSRSLFRLLPAAPAFLAVPSPPPAHTVWVTPSLYIELKTLYPGRKCSVAFFSRTEIKQTDKDKDASSNASVAREKKGTEPTPVHEEHRVNATFERCSAVPNGHIWLSPDLRKALNVALDADDFKMIRIHPQTLSARSNSLKSDAKKGSSASEVKSKSKKHSPAPEEDIQLAGLDDVIAKTQAHVSNALISHSLNPLQQAPSLLITGSSGSGKTSLAKLIAQRLTVDPRTLTYTLYMDCSRFADERHPVLKTKIKDWFDQVWWHAPAILILDNLDRMIPAEMEHADSFASLHLARTFLSYALPALRARPIVVVATAQSSATLHSLLTSTHLFGETVHLKGPSKAQRRDILHALVARKEAKRAQLTFDTLDFVSVAGMTEGYLPADLKDLVDRAIHQVAMRHGAPGAREGATSSEIDLTTADFEGAIVDFVPLSLRDVKLQKSEVEWADIGGLVDTKLVLREMLEWPTKYAPIFANCPLRLRSGLLLYGFPGCGKTLLASAVAKECGLNFISVKGPEILNKYIGASEKSVRDLFERAQAAKPCVLFFDEFDSIAPRRGHDSTGVTDRVVNQMLTQMDGAEGLDGVYVLAATSRPDLIDPALLRPGRLDKSLLCNMPNYDDRLEILKACSRKIDMDENVDFAYFAQRTEGYSGADLQALVYNAHLDAIHSGLVDASAPADMTASQQLEKRQNALQYHILGSQKEQVLSRAEAGVVSRRLETILSSIRASHQQLIGDSTPENNISTPKKRKTSVKKDNLEKSLKSTRPSVPVEELVRLRRIYNEFVSGRSPDGLPSGEASGEIGGRSSLM